VGRADISFRQLRQGKESSMRQPQLILIPVEFADFAAAGHIAALFYQELIVALARPGIF